MQRSISILLPLLILMAACDPFQVADVALPDAPVAQVSFSYVPDDSNRVVLTDNSTNAFTRLWDFGNGSSSDLPSDTAFYPIAGNYTVTLTISGQGGTSVTTQEISILNDAVLDCDSTLINLVGGCSSRDTVAWIFAQEPAAVAIGPTELSTNWFSSPAGGLAPEQYDDEWVFAFAGSRHQYYNNGETIDPAQGFDPVPFDPPTGVTYSINPGAGFNGTTQISLTPGSFIGVKNSGPLYDIIELTETRMVLLSKQTDGDGWFTQIFVRK